MVANPEAIFTLDNKHFIYAHPTRELLEKLGFRHLDF